MRLARILAAGIPLVAAAPGQAPSDEPARADLPPPREGREGRTVRREIEALSARIVELEKAVSAARAAPRSSPASPRSSPGVVSTAGARDAGTQAKAGAGDAAETKVLRDLFQRRDGPALSRELGRLLARGDSAHATLYDFLSELDRVPRQALLLSYDYHFSFSLVHLAMLHEDELAKFAHYFLAAGEKAPQSTLRRTLFDFLPDFLRYHRGRYPDIERDLEEQILRRLREGKGDLQMYYRAMESLGYKPPIQIFDPLLDAASSHAETLPVVLHLEARNDPAAVRILSRNVSRNTPGKDWKSSIMLGALARMSAPEAAEALLLFVQAPEEYLRGPAIQAYFSVPRDESSLPVLQELFNADGDLEKKRLVVLYLRRKNPRLLEALKKESGKFRSEEVRKLLADEDPRKAPR